MSGLPSNRICCNVFYLNRGNKYEIVLNNLGTAVTQWLKCCATNRKVAGSIPDGVIGMFL